MGIASFPGALPLLCLRRVAASWLAVLYQLAEESDE